MPPALAAVKYLMWFSIIFLLGGHFGGLIYKRSLSPRAFRKNIRDQLKDLFDRKWLLAFNVLMVILVCISFSIFSIHASKSEMHEMFPLAGACVAGVFLFASSYIDLDINVRLYKRKGFLAGLVGLLIAIFIYFYLLYCDDERQWSLITALAVMVIACFSGLAIRRPWRTSPSDFFEFITWGGMILMILLVLLVAAIATGLYK